jgi:hypothetical protein
MDLRSTLSSILDSSFDLRSVEVTIRSADGMTYTGKLDYDACGKLTAVLAQRLIVAIENEEQDTLSSKFKRRRALLCEEFGLKNGKD